MTEKQPINAANLPAAKDREADMLIPNTPYSIEGLQRLSKLLVAAGYISGVKDIAQACFKVLAGAEMGLGPIASLNHLYAVNGKIGTEGIVIASRLREAGYHYRIAELSEEQCCCVFFCGADELGSWTYTMKDAARAGLTQKDNWKKHPQNMLFWRAFMNGARAFCADVFHGNAPYLKEELQEEVDTEMPAPPAPVDKSLLEKVQGAADEVQQTQKAEQEVLL